MQDTITDPSDLGSETAGIGPKSRKFVFATHWDDLVTIPLAVASAICVLVMMGSVCYEVMSRTFFGEPTSWVAEYSIYLTIGAAFFGAGFAMREQAHVRADVLLTLLKNESRAVLEQAGAWVAFVFVAQATWNTALYVYFENLHGTRTWGVMQTPMWIPKLVMPIGLFGLMIAIIGEIGRLRGVASMRMAPAYVLTLLACVAVPYVYAAGFPLVAGWFDAPTLLILGVALASALVTTDLPVTVVAAVIVALLGVGLAYVADKSVGPILIAFVVSIIAMLSLGIRIAFAIGLIAVVCLIFLLPVPQTQVIAERAWSSVEPFSLSALPMFVLMGALLLHSGVSRSLFDHAAHMLRRVPAGLAHASAVASTVFSAICGSSVATAATIGTVAFPEMQRRGYHAQLMYGVVAAGGTLGILIPPSITLLVYGSMMGVSVTQLFVAGIIPGLMLSLSFMVVVAIYVAIYPLPTQAVQEPPPPPGSGWRVIPVLLLVAAVLGSMYFGIATPTEAGGVGALLSLVICLFSAEFTLRGFMDSILETVKVTSFILLIMVATGILTYSFDFVRVAATLVSGIEALGLQPWIVALVIAGFYILLGMFIDPMSMMLMTLPVAYPLAVSLGHDPVWFGIVLVLLIEVGLLTPPLGMNLFVIKGLVGPEVPFSRISYGVVPFVIAILVNLLIIYLFPVLVTWLPSVIAN